MFIFKHDTNKLITSISEQQLTSHYQEYNGSNIDMAGLKTRLNISYLCF